MSTKRQRAGWIDKQLENFNMRRGRRGKAIWAHFNRYKELFYDNNSVDKKLIGTGFAAECKYCFISLCANPATLVNHIIETCKAAPEDVQTSVIAMRRKSVSRDKRQQLQCLPFHFQILIKYQTTHHHDLQFPWKCHHQM